MGSKTKFFCGEESQSLGLYVWGPAVQEISEQEDCVAPMWRSSPQQRAVAGDQQWEKEGSAMC